MKNYNWDRPIRGEYLYDDDNLIEIVEYKLKDNSIKKEYKRVFEYNDNNQLILYNFYRWEESSWFLVSSKSYEYDEISKLISIKNKSNLLDDHSPRYYENFFSMMVKIE